MKVHELVDRQVKFLDLRKQEYHCGFVSEIHLLKYREFKLIFGSQVFESRVIVRLEVSTEHGWETVER